MQKLFRNSISYAAFCALALSMSCGKDKTPSPMNCGNNAEKVTTAATTFSQSPTKANCQAYKNAVSDFYKSCATFYTGATKKDLDDFMAEDCPNQ